jgi:hypothetical protein
MSNEFAFPHTTEHLHQPVTAGMTLRDYFAAKAMQGLFSCPDWLDGAGEEVDVPNCMASAAYAMADAMLKARDDPDA